MTTVSDLGEVAMIQRFARRLGRSPAVVVGIGDDAAVLPWTAASYLLFASDMLVEGVHFRRCDVAPRDVGWKALACNISDIAAMGGQPTHAVVSLGLPRRLPVRFVDGLYDGLARCAKRYGVRIVGGDTVRAPCLVVDVAMLGRVEKRRLVRRRGAAVGDRIFVTGRLGGSLISGRHAAFTPRLREARWLVRHLPIHAMMDLSDGLAADLWQLARASGVTLQVREPAIPVSRAAKTCLRRTCECHRWRGRQAVWHALMDGEDFELLFTVPPAAARRMPRRLGRIPVTDIGVVTTAGVGVEWIRHNGRIAPLVPQGFRHF